MNIFGKKIFQIQPTLVVFAVSGGAGDRGAKVIVRWWWWYCNDSVGGGDGSEVV